MANQMGARSFLRQCAVLLFRHHPRAAFSVKSFAQNVSPETVAVLDYPLILDQRWKPYNPYLYDTINERREHLAASIGDSQAQAYQAFHQGPKLWLRRLIKKVAFLLTR